MSAVYDVLNVIRAGLLQSEAIREWCIRNYRMPLRVHVGADESDLPNVERAPTVVIDRGECAYQTVNQMRTLEMEINVVISIVDDEVVEDATGRVYRGVGRVEELAELVRRELINVQGQLVWTGSSPVVNESMTRRHPVYAVVETARVKLMEGRFLK